MLTTDRSKLVDRHLGERVVGADLPEHQVGLVERDLELQALAGGLGELAGKAAIDDLDVEALDVALEDLLEQRRVAVVPQPSTAADEAPMARILIFWRFCSASALLGSGVTPTLVSPHSLATAGGSGAVSGLPAGPCAHATWHKPAATPSAIRHDLLTISQLPFVDLSIRTPMR